ncbi:YdbH family protein [Enterobacteriaceae bacterium H20N1]|uniref:YdbH family protein n=1 Tax=Dryocola boscaweniae TaxID=2925397 RepID=A0A9X3ACR4_9ENTR|nr:YdbH family protein [Dryocola boscaweniae]MCT4703924.1 YdbH family protein [Dryocola boscaweniae]MCT4721092.1 YdbH family protein [Dryocola boscaweniae]
MKGKYKAIIALALLFILLPLALLLTIANWLPTLAGIWLPQGTRIAMEASPRLSRGAIIIPDLRYLAGDCELANLRNARLSHPSRWRLHLNELTLNPDCISKIPLDDAAPAAPRTLAEWQSMLPNTLVTIDKLNVTPWQQFAGGLRVALTPSQQEVHYSGPLLAIDAKLKGQTLELQKLNISAFEGMDPIELAGTFTLPRVPNGLPEQGRITSALRIPQEPELINVELDWHEDQGALTLRKSRDSEPLVSLPWTISQKIFEINGGQWAWPYQGFPLRGGLALRVDDWQQGLENATFSGRMNVVTQGRAGKGNAVLNIGPGKLSMTNSALPLQITGEAKQDALIFYAVLPGELSGALTDPQLLFRPGALLRSRGRVIDSLDIDEIRWPLAGVRLTQRGVDGRLQAIIRAHENEMGNFVLHLDGKADDFMPDAGLWQWRYWGNGAFTPMSARWDVSGKGEWRDSAIELTSLSTGFDKLQYGSMLMNKPRLALEKPVRWQRAQERASFTGALLLEAGSTTFTGGSALPASTLKFSLDGEDPSSFQFKGDLHAGKIGSVRVMGRWDGERLRGNAWWPKQTLTVFQPLIPPDWKMDLKDGNLYAQIAFSAASGQGFEAGGHGVVKSGSVWLPDNQINGVDFVLPFRFSDSTWHLGTHGPVTLRIGEVKNQVTARNITADLDGWYPWSDKQPLTLSNVSVDVLGGKILMQQLRMPQRDAALLRLQDISSSELVTAVNPKQFTLSGRLTGALPLWLNHPQWIIKDGWLTNPGPMTFRMDKDMADAIVANNMAAGSAINWLRYMEISRSWAKINLDNLGEVSMSASVTGISHVEGKKNTVHLNYTHQENLFTLWRSLRFGDNLQNWLEQHAALPGARCQTPGEACEETQ